MFSFIEFPKWIHSQVFSFLPIRWYALMYIVAFGITYVLYRGRCKKETILGGISQEKIDDFFIYAILGLIIGARVFSTLLYNGSFYYWTHPWMIFWPFRNGKFIGLPGMSYHGGVVGGFVGAWIFAKKNKLKLLDCSDSVLVAVPLGYTFGRLGNFINGELWGRCTGTSYGMIFPDAPLFSTAIPWVRNACDKAGIAYITGDIVNLPRHPSQLYEALFEGVVLFLIMWFLVAPYEKKRKTGPGFATGCYLALYGMIRFVIEYFREPDEELGFIIALGKESEPTALFKSLLNISLGQILCFIMVVVGVLLIVRSKKTEPTVYTKRKKK